MAAAKGNKNASGSHRVADINDKKLAAEVRVLALSEIKEILTTPANFPTLFRQQLLLKLAGTVLPRLNEHTGAEGKDLFPTPLLANLPNVSDNHGNAKGSVAPKENKGSPGGNVSQQDDIDTLIPD